MDKVERRLLLVWLVLILATLASWESSTTLARAYPALPVVIVLVLAFFKVRLVMLEFMEVRAAPLALRAALELWVVLACAALALLLAGAETYPVTT
jgi:hypothetical protein